MHWPVISAGGKQERVIGETNQQLEKTENSFAKQDTGAEIN